MLTVDANVWIAANDPSDTHMGSSRDFLAAAARRQEIVYLPSFAEIEIACALARRRRSSEVGQQLAKSIMSLSQVAKHGGEITRQLQELADAVATQRETKIDAKIKKLELEATAPVALVFMGFLIILLIGFGIQIYRAI